MTTIEWTHPPGYRGESWNPVTGCTKVSQGCKHCYAERVFPRAYAASGRQFVDVLTHPDRLGAPLKRRAPTCWFVNSMSDLFHEAVPDEFIDRVFAVMALAPKHRFIVLTKRPARMREYLSDARLHSRLHEAVKARMGYHHRQRPAINAADIPLPNVWLGVSAEDQATADKRIPLLLQTPAAVRLVSLEPLLGPVDLDPLWLRPSPSTAAQNGRTAHLPLSHWTNWHTTALDWLIVGGESGPGARPCDVAWIRSIVTQGQAAGVAVFVKQLGARPAGWCVGRLHDDLHLRDRDDYCDIEAAHEGAACDAGCRLLSDRKGGDPSEWPEDLRVRGWPTPGAGR